MRVKQTRNLTAIQNSRSPNDVISIVLKISKSIRKTKDVTDKLLASISNTAGHATLSISTADYDETEFSGIKRGDTSHRRVKRKGDVAAQNSNPSIRFKVDVPDINLDDIIRDTQNLEDLSQGIMELEVADQVLRSQTFKSQKSQEKALTALTPILNEAREEKDRLLKTMLKLSGQHKPKAHMDVVKTLNKHIKFVLDDSQYSEIKGHTFTLHPNKDEVWFQTYLNIQDLANRDDHIYYRYSIVVTGVLNLDSGDLVYHMTSIKDNLTPGSFGIGQEVKNVTALKNRVNSLFSVDTILVIRDRVAIPAAAQGKELEKKGILNVSKFVTGVRVSDDSMLFRLIPGLDKKEKEEVISSIYPFLRTLLYRSDMKRAKKIDPENKVLKRNNRTLSLQHQFIRGKRGKDWVKIVIVPIGHSATEILTANKLTKLAKELDLSQRQLKELKAIL